MQAIKGDYDMNIYSTVLNNGMLPYRTDLGTTKKTSLPDVKTLVQKTTECGKRRILSNKQTLEIPLNQKIAFGLSMATLGFSALSYSGFSPDLAQNLGMMFQVASGISLIQNCFRQPALQTAVALASLGLAQTSLRPLIYGINTYSMVSDSYNQAKISLNLRNGKNDLTIARNLFVYTTNALHSSYNLFQSLPKKLASPEANPEEANPEEVNQEEVNREGVNQEEVNREGVNPPVTPTLKPTLKPTLSSRLVVRTTLSKGASFTGEIPENTLLTTELAKDSQYQPHDGMIMLFMQNGKYKSVLPEKTLLALQGALIGSVSRMSIAKSIAMKIPKITKGTFADHVWTLTDVEKIMNACLSIDNPSKEYQNALTSLTRAVYEKIPK